MEIKERLTKRWAMSPAQAAGNSFAIGHCNHKCCHILQQSKIEINIRNGKPFTHSEYMFIWDKFAEWLCKKYFKLFFNTRLILYLKSFLVAIFSNCFLVEKP